MPWIKSTNGFSIEIWFWSDQLREKKKVGEKFFAGGSQHASFYQQHLPIEIARPGTGKKKQLIAGFLIAMQIELNLKRRKIGGENKTFRFPMANHGDIPMLARKFLCKVQKRCKLYNIEANNRYCHHYRGGGAGASILHANHNCQMTMKIRRKATVKWERKNSNGWWKDWQRKWRNGTEIHNLIKLNYDFSTFFCTDYVEK